MTAVINNLTEFKSILKTPNVKIRGLSHYRQDEPRIEHFIQRFKTSRSITHVKRSYFDIEGGSRLDLTHKAGWLFSGTNVVTLQLNPPACHQIVYEIEVPS